MVGYHFDKSGEEWELGMLIVKRYRNGWMLAADMKRIRQSTEFPYSWTESSRIVRVIRHGKDFITATAGRADIIKIIAPVVRGYIEGKGVRNYQTIVEGTKHLIHKGMRDLCCSRNYEEDEVTGSVVVVDRNQHEVLTIIVNKAAGDKEFLIFHSIRESEVIGSATNIIESQIGDMKSDDEYKAKDKLLAAMNLVAKEDDSTGGNLMIFEGKEDMEWTCIHIESIPIKDGINSSSSGTSSAVQ